MTVSQKPTSAWISFCYAALLTSGGILAYGLFTMPIDVWQRLFLFMGISMFAQAVVIATKTMRDVAEAERAEKTREYEV